MHTTLTVTGALLLQGCESGTPCRLNCNNVILSCNLSGVGRLLSLGCGTTVLCDLRKFAPYKNSLTYLLTYFLRARLCDFDGVFSVDNMPEYACLVGVQYGYL